jgi:predicted PurR-regulated permease PerM
MNKNRQWWIIGGAISLVVLIHLLAPILMPFLVGSLLAYLGDPLVDRLENRRVNRTFAVCIVFSAFVALLSLFVLLMLPLLGRQWESLLARIPELIQLAQQEWLPWLQQRFNLPDVQLPVEKLKSSLQAHWREAGNVMVIAMQYISQSGLALLVVLANIFLIPVVSFYLLRDWDILMAKIRDLLPRSIEPVVVKLALDCDEVLSAFLRGQLLVMFSLGVIYSIGLTIVGLDVALILGTLAGLASVVPYMGVIVGIIAAGFAAYFQFHEWLPLVYVLMVFGVGQLLEGSILTPLLVGDKIGLHPVAVIFAIMAGGQLAGFVGILLALPVAAIIMVLLRYFHQQYRSSDLYAERSADDQPVVSEQEPLKQEPEQTRSDSALSETVVSK